MDVRDWLLAGSEAERQDAIATTDMADAISNESVLNENSTARQRKLARVKKAAQKSQAYPVVQKIVEEAILSKPSPQPDAEFAPYMDFQTPDLNSGYFSQEDMGNQVADAVRPLGTDVGEYQAMLTDAQLDASRNISDQYARALRGGQSYEQYRAKLAADYLSGNKRYDTTGEFNDLESLTGVSQMNPNTNVDLPSLMGDMLYTGVDSAVGAGELAVGSANWLSQNALQDELNYIKTAREALRDQFASDELKAQMANVQNAKMSENPIADTIAELASNPRNAMYLAGSNALTMLPILGAGKLTGQAFKTAPVIAEALGMTGRGVQIAETMANLAPQAQRWGGVGADMIANGQEQYNDLISETDANGNRKYTDDEANLAGAITALGTLATHHITGGGLEDIILREGRQVAKQEAQSGIKGALKTALEVAEPVISETAEEGLQSLSGTAGRKLVTGEEFTAGDIANAIEEASAGGFSATPHTARNIVSKIANADTAAQQATQNKVVNQNQQNLTHNNVSQSNVNDNKKSNTENEQTNISNDKETKLTDYQRKVARTSNFKRWFGFDWERDQKTNEGKSGNDSSSMGGQMDSVRSLRSQIHDAESRGELGRARNLRAKLGKNLGRLNLLDPETNEPRVFYHGTKDDFSSFDLNHKNKKDAGNIGHGIYLAPNPENARQYGQNKQKGEASLNIMPLFASMKNPYIMDATNKASNLSEEGAKKFTEKLKNEGYDGILAFNFNMPDWQDEPTMAVVFNPSQVKSAVGNNGDFDSNNDNILFSKSDKKNKGMSAEQVRQAISSDKANESVVVVQSKEELPAHLQGKADDNADGLYDPETNKAYLIANNISSEEQAQKKAGHEVIAHYGMENMLGEEEMNKLCDRVTNALKKGNKTLRKYSNAVNKTQPGLHNRIHAREIIAEMVENGEENMITKRVVDAIKRFLNRLGFKFDLTTADIRKALRDARKYVKQGKSNAKNATKQTMFSKKTDNKQQAIDDFISARKQYGSTSEQAKEAEQRMKDAGVSYQEAFAGKPKHILREDFDDIRDEYKAFGRDMREFNRKYADWTVVEEDGSTTPAIKNAKVENKQFSKTKSNQLRDGRVVVRTTERSSDKERFKQLARLAKENDGDYSYKGAEDGHGGLGAFVFPSQQTAQAFQEAVEQLPQEQNNETQRVEKQEKRKIGDVPKTGEQVDSRQQELKEQLGETKYNEMQQNALKKYRDARQNLISKGENATDEDIQRVQEAIQSCEHWGVNKEMRSANKASDNTTVIEEEQTPSPEMEKTETTEEKGDASWQSADENDQPKSKVEEGQETEDEESFAPENERSEPDPIIDPQPNVNAFEVPRETGMKKRWRDFIRRTQDRMTDIKRIQDAVEQATGEATPDSRNVYLADEAYQARTQEQQRVLRENYENKILKLASKTKLTADEISDWLAARHITLDKVNARLARKYGEDNLTGWTDKQALEEYNKHKDNDDMQAIGKLMDDMHNHVLDLHMQNNMIDRVSYDNVKNAYKHYVPLRDVDEGFEHVKGTGFSLIGGELKYRKGKKHKETANVLSQAFINSETAVRRIEKTRVGRTLLRFVQSYQNDTFWKVTNRKGENVPENVLVVRDSNAVDQWITFNKADPIAMHVHNALKNLDAKELPKTVQKIGALNNYLGKWITSKNPGFILRNLIRDVPNALLNISATKIKGKQVEVLKTMPSAWMGMRNFIKNGTFADKDGVVNEVDKYVQEFIENGGKTNFVPLDGNVIGRTEQIEKMLKTMEDDTSDKRNMFKALGKLVEDTNAIAENVVRLSSFIVARKQGLSIPQAVHIARNVSVNFGRRGSDTSWISAFYLFGNASVQGTATLVNTLKKSKRARIVVGAMVGAGFANRMLVQLMFGGLNGGLDDDDTYISQFEKDNYYLVPYKFGDVLDDFVKIPVSHGLKVFHILGGYIADLIFNHKAQRDPLSYGVNAMLSAMSDYSPFGQGSIGQAIMPTFFQPAMGLLYDNKTGTGGDIVQKGNPDMPAYHNAKYNTEKHWKWLSQAFNYVTGGGDNVGEKGWLQVQPDWMKYAIESYLMPGAITDIDRTFGAVEKLVDRFIKGDGIKPMERKADEITSKDIPIIGGFHGSPWHIWEATNDVNYDDKPKNKADMDDAMERREKRDGSGWGRDGEYHEAKDKVFADIVNGDRPIVRDNRGIKDDEKSLWTFDNKQIEDTLSRMIGSAKDEIYVASYEMSLPRATEQLIAARQRGVKVNIVVDAKQNRDRASENALTALKNAGCNISESSAYNAMHQKVVIVDGKHSFSGSFNLSQNAVMRNSENATFVFNNTDWANQGAYGIREPFQRSHVWESKKDYNEETGKKNKYKTKLEVDIARKMGEVNSQAEARYVLDKERRSADRYRGYNDEGKSTKGSREYNALMGSIRARLGK